MKIITILKHFMVKVSQFLGCLFSKKSENSVKLENSSRVLSESFNDRWVEKKLASVLQVNQDSIWVDVFLCGDDAYSNCVVIEDSHIFLAYKKLRFFCLKQGDDFSSSLKICYLSDEYLEYSNKFYDNEAVQGFFVFIDINSALIIRIKKEKSNQNLRFSDRYLRVLRMLPSAFWISIADKVLLSKHKEKKVLQRRIRNASNKCLALTNENIFLESFHSYLNDIFQLKQKVEFVQVGRDNQIFSKKSCGDVCFFDELYSRYHNIKEFQQISFKCSNQIMRYGFIEVWESCCKTKKGYLFLELKKPMFSYFLFGFVRVAFSHLLKLKEQSVSKERQELVLKQMNAVSFPIYVFKKYILEQKEFSDHYMLFKNQEASVYESQGFSLKNNVLSKDTYSSFECNSLVYEFKCVINKQDYYCFYQWVDLSDNLVLLYVIKICPVDKAANLSKILKEQDTISILAAGVAHEIKNPLAPMKSLTQLLESNWEDKHLRKKYCDVILPQIERINDLCDSLRKLKIFRPGRKNIENLIEILKESILIVEPVERQSTIVVENHLKTLPMALVDYDQFIQVFQNILQNAVDASPKDSIICVSFSLQKSMLSICIEDQGKGLSKYELENMFNVFFTTKSSGNGLGMMMVKKILDDHHATIHVLSQKGKGCSVTILLKPDKSICLSENIERYVC